jgi:beta-lactamase class C
VTPDTLFELGSVSKTFTGLLGAWVHAEGGFAFEDAASRGWDELAGSVFDRVTMDQLATYSAGGLPLQVPREVRNDSELMEYLKHWRPEFEPGTTRRYSNPSIGFFGRAAAKRAGVDFSVMMTGTILPALRMRDTYVRVPEAAMPRYAWGCDDEDRAVRVNPGVLDAEAYGIKSSAADMGRYLQAQIAPSTGVTDPRVAETLKRALAETRRGRYRVGPMTQGLGWEIYAYPLALEELVEGNSMQMSQRPNKVSPAQRFEGAVLLSKTGSTGGFSAYAVVVPSEEIGVVVLANRTVPAESRIGAAYAILQAAKRK